MQICWIELLIKYEIDLSRLPPNDNNVQLISDLQKYGADLDTILSYALKNISNEPLGQYLN